MSFHIFVHCTLPKLTNVPILMQWTKKTLESESKSLSKDWPTHPEKDQLFSDSDSFYLLPSPSLTKVEASPRFWPNFLERQFLTCRGYFIASQLSRPNTDPSNEIACIQKPRKLFLAKTRPSLGVDWVPLPTRQQPTHQWEAESNPRNWEWWWRDFNDFVSW